MLIRGKSYLGGGETMLAILFAIASVVCSALNCILFKSAMRRGNYAWATLIVFHIVAVALLIVFTEIPDFLTLDTSVMMLLLLSCMFWVFGDLYGVKAYEYLDATVCELYGTLKLILITGVGIVLFQESLSVLAVVGLLLIIGAISYEYRGDAQHNPRGVFFMFLNVVLITGALCVDKYLTTLVADDVIVFYGFLLPMIVYVVLGHKALPQALPLLRDTKGLFLLTPILGVAAYACLIRALAIGDLSVTYTIQETAVIFIFLFEVVLLKVRQDLFSRAGSCLACATGAMMVCTL
jgi:drug/metabolite transporter (DMT)-like permease